MNGSIINHVLFLKKDFTTEDGEVIVSGSPVIAVGEETLRNDGFPIEFHERALVDAKQAEALGQKYVYRKEESRTKLFPVPLNLLKLA